ncbi:MAG: nicotinate phosphoribosyltransferase [Bacteroidetes bacterium]|jgi:nicotinate phosphoribosyltransferase|nr:nicotinate phosphoribosyltransferase [Bacteroidota bacterium]
MKNPFLHTALYTDFYELTMAQGYFYNHKQKEAAIFDYFYRTNPFNGGYAVFAGLSTALAMIQSFYFSEKDIDYLEQQGFQQEFLDYLSNFTFTGDVYAVSEGEIIFPHTPVLRVEGNIIETQIIESLLLNILNFQSLIATKAARIKYAAKDTLLLEFGLRRAQGWGGLLASKAAIIGGFQKTSNVLSAQRYNLEASGTMAHSWIQVFNTELEAFRAYANIYGNQTILLVDTYDTENLGIPNAIKVAHEMERKGKKLKGIRIDSGNLLEKSKLARKMLDENGLQYVTIVLSNQLDEFAIYDLLSNNAPVDAFGVGTALSVGIPDAALDGIYKLVDINGKPTMKFSDDKAKITMPGKKELVRYYNSNKTFAGDGICYPEETGNNTYYSIPAGDQKFKMKGSKSKLLLTKVMEEGEMIVDQPTVYESQQYFLSRFAQLPDDFKSFQNPQKYIVGISPEIVKMQQLLKHKEENV